MTTVRFASICDHCEARSTEYFAYPVCRECQADVCDACMVPGSHDPEFGVCNCKRCAETDLEESARINKLFPEVSR